MDSKKSPERDPSLDRFFKALREEKVEAPSGLESAVRERLEEFQGLTLRRRLFRWFLSSPALYGSLALASVGLPYVATQLSNQIMKADPNLAAQRKDASTTDLSNVASPGPSASPIANKSSDLPPGRVSGEEARKDPKDGKTIGATVGGAPPLPSGTAPDALFAPRILPSGAASPKPEKQKPKPRADGGDTRIVYIAVPTEETAKPTLDGTASVTIQFKSRDSYGGCEAPPCPIIPNPTRIVQGYVEVRRDGRVEIHQKKIALSTSGEITLKELKPGKVKLHVSVDGFLAVNLNLDLKAEQITVPAELFGGDFNNDNFINTDDYQILNRAFDSSLLENSTNWNPRCDADGDGVISVLDYGILSNHFEMRGDQ